MFEAYYIDKTSLYRRVYLNDPEFYAFVIQNLVPRFHFKLLVKPRTPQESSGPSEMQRLDPVQVDLVKQILGARFNAKDLKDYPSNKPAKECIKMFFSFESRDEAQAFYDFSKDRSKYEGEGINSKLQVYLLQTGKPILL